MEGHANFNMGVMYDNLGTNGFARAAACYEEYLCACRLRGLPRASEATHSTALPRTREAPKRSPKSLDDPPDKLSVSLAS